MRWPLVSTELLKLWTVRSPALLTGAAVLITGFIALQAILDAGRAGAPSIGTAVLQQALLRTAGRAQLIALTLGVLTAVTERRHGTLTGTLLQTPGRIQLLVAKVVAAAVTGLALGVLTLSVVVLVALGSGALTSPAPAAGLVLTAAGQLATYPLYAVLGAGIGTLLAGSPPVAVLLPLAWLLLLEGFIGSLVRAAAPWLPGQAAAGLTSFGDVAGLLPAAAAGLVLLGYALILAGAGAARTARLDVA